jgi:Domain of unknown function (DUF397)
VDLAYNGVRASRLWNAVWRKSRFSNPSGNCVELADLSAEVVAVRNSRDPDGPALIFTRAEWDAFLQGARAGEFGLFGLARPLHRRRNGSCVAIKPDSRPAFAIVVANRRAYGTRPPCVRHSGHCPAPHDAAPGVVEGE